MNDIEQDLRELFRERADRIVVAGAPEPVLRRARRRQIWTIAVGSLAAITVIAVSLAGLRGLLRDRPDHGPATEAATLVASGDAYDLHWTLSSWVDNGRFCTRLEWNDTRDASRTPPGESASCGGIPLADRATFSVIETESNVSFLVALVPNDVLEVVVENEETRRFSTGRLFAAPGEWGSLHFAVVALEGEGSATVHFVGAGDDIAHPSVGFWQWGKDSALDPTNLTHFATVPGDITARIRSIEFEGTRRTLFAWGETGTSKFVLYLGEGDGSRKAIAWAGTADGIQQQPILSIGPLACDRRVSVLWGTVPGNVASIELLHHSGEIKTIAGPSEFGNVRFVLSPLEEPYPGSVWLRFLDANGQPMARDWLSAGCFERPPEPPEA